MFKVGAWLNHRNGALYKFRSLSDISPPTLLAQGDQSEPFFPLVLDELTPAVLKIVSHRGAKDTEKIRVYLRSIFIVCGAVKACCLSCGRSGERLLASVMYSRQAIQRHMLRSDIRLSKAFAFDQLLCGR